VSETMGLLDAPIILRLGLALVHFVWQGAIAAVVALLVLVALRRASAAARYVALLVVFAGMAACPVLTFALLPGPAQPMPAGALFEPMDATALPTASGEAASMAMALAPPLPSPGATRSERWRTRLGSAWEWLEARLSWVAAVWMVGVLALSARLLIGWGRMMRGKRRAAVMTEGRWREVVAALSRRLRVSRPVRLMESAAAGVPTVVGWLRPVILLPTSALAGLTPEQLEAVIAHELAHVRRHDYVVNLAQTVVETLLFYHPAVWWVSSRIRAEREHCCDDLAVAVCGDAVSYARALAELEQLRAPQLAVAAGGGALVGRVRRLVGADDQDSGRRSSWMAAVIAVGVLAAIWSGMDVGSRGIAAQEHSETVARADVVFETIRMEHVPAGYVAYLFGDARFGPAVTTAFGGGSDPVEGRRGSEDAGRGGFGGGGEESGAGALRELLPEGIRLVTAAHYNSHHLLVGGTPESIAELRELLTYLDRKPQGVRISATAYPGAPAECAEVRAHQVAGNATRDGQDITVYSIADERRMRFPELPTGFRPQSVEVDTLNLMPEVAPVPRLPGRPQVLLRAVPRINGDGTVTLNLWMSVLGDPEKARAALTPEQGDVQTTVNVGDGEAFGVLLRHGDEEMTIVIKPTVVAPTG